MSFDKSFPSNGVSPPATSKQQTPTPNPSFAPSFVPGALQVYPTPQRPVDPLSTSLSNVFPQGFFAAPQAGDTNGYATQNTAVSITLSIFSVGYQRANPSTYDCAWILPDARALTLGDKFQLENISQFPMPVQANDGTLVGWCMPQQIVVLRLLVNTSVAGTWKIKTGERDRDAGLNWWGALSTTNGSITNTSSFISIALSTQYGIIGYFSSGTTNYNLVGYSIAENRVEFGAVGTLIAAANLSSFGCIDGVALSTTEALFIYKKAGAFDTSVVTVDINTTTLALTVNSPVSIDTTPTTAGGFSCDKISSSLALVTYGASTYIKTRTISVAAGVCTANTAASVAAAACLQSSVKVLSATLAHVQYDDGSNNLKVNRIVLSGTTATPGTQVAVTNRLSSYNGSSPVYNLGKVSATSSWTICTDSQSMTYGEVYTDTGSTITITETSLITGPTASAGGLSIIEIPHVFSVNDYSNNGIIEFHNQYIMSFKLARVSGTAVTLTPTLKQSANLAAVPSNSTTVQVLDYTVCRTKPYNGVGIYGVSKSSTPAIAMQPFAIA